MPLMKKILFIINLSLVLCGSTHSAKNENILNENKNFNKDTIQNSTPISLQTILKNMKKLEPKQKELIAEIISARLRYILTILAELEAKKCKNPLEKNAMLDSATFDAAILELQRKNETISDQLSANGLDVFAQIDCFSKIKSPNWNMELINCFMDLRCDFTNKFFNCFFKKLLTLKKAHSIILSKEVEEALEENKQNPFYFFSVKNISESLTETSIQICSKMEKIAKVSNNKQLSVELEEIKKNECVEAEASRNVLVNTCSTFESAITDLRQAHIIFQIYRKVLEQCKSDISNGTSLQKTIDILDALLLLNTNEKKLNKIATCTEQLKILLGYITEDFLQQTDEKNLSIGLPKTCVEKTITTLKKSAPGFIHLFWENFLDAELNKKLNFLRVFIQPPSDKDESIHSFFNHINGSFLLYPLLQLMIKNLEQTTEKLSLDKLEHENKKEQKEEKKKFKKKQKEAENWLMEDEKKSKRHKQKTDKNSKKKNKIEKKEEKNTINKKKNRKKNKIEIAATMQIFKEEKDENKELITKNSADPEIANSVKNASEHLKQKPLLKEINKHFVFTVGTNTATGVRNGIITFPKNNISNNISPTDLDFDTLKKEMENKPEKNNAYHKIPAKSFKKSSEVLQKCEVIYPETEDQNYLTNICSIYKITIDPEIKTLLLLPCHMKITCFDAGKSLKTISKKIKNNDLGDQRTLGLHEGAIVLLSEDSLESLTKNRGKKLHIKHLFFHESQDTKIYHDLKKKNNNFI